MNTLTDSVRIVLFAKNHTFLALSETDDQGTLKLPGGKFDTTDETPDEAAARELKEELGLEARAVGLRLIDELVNDDGVSRRFIYMAYLEDVKLVPSSEIHHIEWLTEETIPAGKNQGHMRSAIVAAVTVLR